jgi:hypothetical protein
MDDTHVDVERPMMATEESVHSVDASMTEPTISEQLDPIFVRRLQQIRDHLQEVVGNPNRLTVCLAGVNSDLMELQLYVGKALREALVTGGFTIEDVEKYSRLMDLMIRLAKQICQLSQLAKCSAKGELFAAPTLSK